MIYQIAVYYFAIYLAYCASLSAHLLAGRAFAIPVREIRIGALPVFRRGKLSVGLLPVSAFVQFADSRREDTADTTGITFDGQPRWVRAIVQLVAVAGFLLLAFVLRGNDAWHSFVNGFGQWLQGTLHPTTRGVELIEGYARFADREGPLAAAGVIAAKAAALNLLPIPAVAGFRALIELLTPAGGGAFYEKLQARLQVVGLVILLAVAVTWAWALVTLVTR